MKLLTTFCLLLWVANSSPFAPKADIPANPNNDPDIALMIQFINTCIVPDRENVGVDAYDDAKIFQTAKAGELMSPLNMVRTYSEAPLENVLEFYKNQVPSDWVYKDIYGIHSLWKGDEMEAMLTQIPVISIQKADDFNNIWPNAKTIIVIYYN